MIYVLNYEGKSLISRAIQAVTWSKFSHTALCDKSGLTIEAWHHGGVEITEHPWVNHKPETPITVYAFDDNADLDMIWFSMSTLVGKKYDFRALLGFLPVLRYFWADSNSHWFCSHSVVEACRMAFYDLFSLQTMLYKVSPGLIDMSPRLTRIGTVKDMVEFWKLVGDD